MVGLLSLMITTKTILQTAFGPFEVQYHRINGEGHILFAYGDVSKDIPIIRIHSACLFGEALHSLHCDCDHQLTETMKQIQKYGTGIIIYSYQEGRGIGLEKKIAAMEIQRITGADTVEAFKQLGLKSDYRTYRAEVEILKTVGVNKTIYIFSGNPHKRNALERAGFHIAKELEIKSSKLHPLAIREKRVKAEKMGYSYKKF